MVCVSGCRLEEEEEEEEEKGEEGGGGGGSKEAAVSVQRLVLRRSASVPVTLSLTQDVSV